MTDNASTFYSAFAHVHHATRLPYRPIIGTLSDMTSGRETRLGTPVPKCFSFQCRKSTKYIFSLLIKSSPCSDRMAGRIKSTPSGCLNVLVSLLVAISWEILLQGFFSGNRWWKSKTDKERANSVSRVFRRWIHGDLEPLFTGRGTRSVKIMFPFLKGGKWG